MNSVLTSARPQPFRKMPINHAGQFAEKLADLNHPVEIEDISDEENQRYKVANITNVAGIDLSAAIDPCTEIAVEKQAVIDKAIGVIEEALSASELNTEKLFSDQFIQAARTIQTHTRKWEQYRARIKAKNAGSIRMSEIDKATALPAEAVRESEAENKASNSIASELVSHVIRNGELFSDPDGDKTYVSIAIKGADHTLQIGSRAFAQWLSYTYFEYTKDGRGYGKSVSEAATKQACTTLAGIATFEGQRHRVHIRVAENNGGYYVFLGDGHQRVIEVLPTGWQIINHSPIKFWKPASMKSLPIPKRGGDLSLLWQFINIPTPSRPLVLAWLLESWRLKTPKPVLSLTGTQGSAKSSTQDKIRQLIDNNSANLRAAPQSVDDVYVSAASNWLLSFENISHLSNDLQDALCTLATGAGSSKRKLYSDDEENVIQFKRPVIINSISAVITAQDLTDRAICIEIPAIDEYQEEALIETRWQAAMPSVIGALLDLFVKTLEQLPKVKLKNPPRMADFTRLGEAMMQALGYKAGSFQTIYNANRQSSIDSALESSCVAQAISKMVYNHPVANEPLVFYGTMKTLLAELSCYCQNAEGWPRTPKALSDALKRQMPALKSVGIEVAPTNKVERVAEDRGYTVKIRKTASYAIINSEMGKTSSTEVVFDPSDKERF